MSGEGAPGASVDGTGLRIAVVAASWHERVMAGLIAGAQRAADEAGAHVDLFRVPGSFELPVACQRAAASGFDAVVALGVIIRGDTPHFEYVSSGVTQGLTKVALEPHIHQCTDTAGYQGDLPEPQQRQNQPARRPSPEQQPRLRDHGRQSDAIAIRHVHADLQRRRFGQKRQIGHSQHLQSPLQP